MRAWSWRSRPGTALHRGMVNAVLRKLAASRSGSARSAGRGRLASAHPAWMVERWSAILRAEAARAICRHGQSAAARSRFAHGRGGCEEELAGGRRELGAGRLLTAARPVVSGDVTATAAFREGRVRLQDEGSQLVAEIAAGPRRSSDSGLLRGAGREDADSWRSAIRRRASWPASRARSGWRICASAWRAGRARRMPAGRCGRAGR